MNVFYGWVIVAVGIVVTCVGFGAMATLTVFLVPVADAITRPTADLRSKMFNAPRASSRWTFFFFSLSFSRMAVSPFSAPKSFRSGFCSLNRRSSSSARKYRTVSLLPSRTFTNELLLSAAGRHGCLYAPVRKGSIVHGWLLSYDRMGLEGFEAGMRDRTAQAARDAIGDGAMATERAGGEGADLGAVLYEALALGRETVSSSASA